MKTVIIALAAGAGGAWLLIAAFISLFICAWGGLLDGYHAVYCIPLTTINVATLGLFGSLFGF